MARNFIFMQNQYPEVYDALEKAEKCAYSDPHNSVMKCGIAVELIIENIFKLIGKEIPAKNQNLANLIHILRKEGILSDEELDMANKANNIRSKRNKAAHTLNILQAEAVDMLDSVYTFCVWFYGHFIDRGLQVENFKTPSMPLHMRIKEFLSVGARAVCLSAGKLPRPTLTQAVLMVTLPGLGIHLYLTNMIVSANGELRMALKPEVRNNLESLEKKFLNA